MQDQYPYQQFIVIPAGAGPGQPRIIIGGSLPTELATYGYSNIIDRTYYVAGNDNVYYYRASAPGLGVDTGFVDLTRTPQVNPLRVDQYVPGPSALFQSLFVNGTAVTQRNDLLIGPNSRNVAASWANANGAATAANTSSGTYADLTSQSVSWIKEYDATALEVDWHGTMYANTATAGVTVGVRYNGVDYDIAQLALTNGLLGSHTQLSGHRVISIAAPNQPGHATYTIQMRWKRNGGTGNLNVDGNDWFSLTAREVAAA